MQEKTVFCRKFNKLIVELCKEMRMYREHLICEDGENKSKKANRLPND